MEIDAIRGVYTKMIEVVNKEFVVGQTLAFLKLDLENDVLKATAEGKIEGKNTQARDAVAFQMFAPRYEQLAQKQKEYDQAQLDRRVAQLELDCVRDILRVEELAKPR